jgi:AcrR family transcriptional regulator
MKKSGRASTPNSKRRYDGRGRQEGAKARRRQVIDAAHRLFLDQGYGATSIEQIAAAAEVSTQTVYAAFVSKAGILARVIDVAIGGDDEEVKVRDRPEFRALAEATTPQELVGAVVRFARATHERSGPILHLLESVAGTEPALAELAADIRRQSADEARHVLTLTPDEWLRPDISADDRSAISYVLGSYWTWWSLVEDLGWTGERYEQFLNDTLMRIFVEDAGAEQPGQR